MATSDSAQHEDPSENAPRDGQSAIARNVVSNWLWYSLVMVSGFVIPRLIGDHLGKDLLGIWDFGWSLVVYVRWLQVGIGGSVARYVARYRAKGDWDALNASVNSSLAVLLVGSMLGVGIAFVLAHFAPRILPAETSAPAVAVAGTITPLLILSVVFDLFGSAVNSVITGCERFDVLNIIRGVRDGGVMVGMIVLLLTGYGVVALGVLTLCGSTICTVAWLVAARRVCPELRYSPASCSWPVAKEMIVFGGKNVVQSSARSALYMVNAVLITAYVGLPALAVFSRQRALVLQGLNFVKHYAHVFVPTSSSLHAQGDVVALRRMLAQSSKYGLYAALPLLLVLLFMGGPLLHLWMGQEYMAPLVLAILVVGHLFSVPQQAVYMILVGMNKHGRPALYELAAAAMSIVVGFVLIGPLEGGLLGAAVAVAVPIAIFPGIVMPLYACKLLELKVADYLKEMLPGPCLANVPLAGCLAAALVIWPDAPVRALVSGAGVGSFVTAIIYWRWVVPEPLRAKVLGILFRRRRRKNRLVNYSV